MVVDESSRFVEELMGPGVRALNLDAFVLNALYALEQIDPRMALIVVLRNGWDGGGRRTYPEIGPMIPSHAHLAHGGPRTTLPSEEAAWGITSERTLQVYQTALRILRHPKILKRRLSPWLDGTGGTQRGYTSQSARAESL